MASKAVYVDRNSLRDFIRSAIDRSGEGITLRDPNATTHTHERPRNKSVKHKVI